MVPVYDENNNIIAMVKYTTNLDYWDGKNYSSGGVGRHKGITQLENGEYVLIFGTDWSGEKDWAKVISAERALQEILASGNISLLDEFPEIKELAEKTLIKERQKKGE